MGDFIYSSAARNGTSWIAPCGCVRIRSSGALPSVRSHARLLIECGLLIISEICAPPCVRLHIFPPFSSVHTLLRLLNAWLAPCHSTECGHIRMSLIPGSHVTARTPPLAPRWGTLQSHRFTCRLIFISFRRKYCHGLGGYDTAHYARIRCSLLHPGLTVACASVEALPSAHALRPCLYRPFW